MVLLHALKPACSSEMIVSACGWSLLKINFNIALLKWLMRLCSVGTSASFLSFCWQVITRDLVQSVDVQDILQTQVMTSIIASPPALTYSAGTLLKVIEKQ